MQTQNERPRAEFDVMKINAVRGNATSTKFHRLRSPMGPLPIGGCRFSDCSPFPAGKGARGIGRSAVAFRVLFPFEVKIARAAGFFTSNGKRTSQLVRA